MSTTSKNVRSGIFLFVSIAALVGLVFVLGRQQSLFSRHVRLHTSFFNISGLVVGTPVRLAGLNVGLVEDINFDKDPAVKNVHVVLGIESRYLDRIREDSIASLGSKGLLGDMIVNITVGDPDSPMLHKGSTLVSKETAGLTELVATVQDAIGNIKEAAGDLGKAMKGLLTKQVNTDIGHIVHSAANITAQVENGGGLLHTILYERKMAADATAFVASARQIGVTADRALLRVDKILSETDLKRALHDIQRAAAELADVTAAIKTGKGLAHTLIFEEDHSKLVENLTALSDELRKVGDDLGKGKGTVGALLKDPTIYTDLKIILGNVKRSRLLRSLVRYTVAADDLEAPK